LAQAPVLALLIVLVYGRDVREAVTDENWARVGGSLAVTLFLMLLAALWFGCSNAGREVVGEGAVYHRGRMVNLRGGSYIASKFTVLGGLCLLQCAALLGIVSWGCGLKGPWWPMLGLLVLASLNGLALGLLISAVSRTSEAAVSLLPIVLLALVILGGL